MSNVSQLNDLRSYSRHWLGEFIDMYQAEECLWQPKHPDYSNHVERNKAYDKLVEKLKEVEPNPDRAMVVRKINSLRSAFRREFRKTTAKANYETRLWYYEKLLFIADQSPKRLSISGVDAKGPKRSLGLSFEEDESMEFEDETNTQVPDTPGSAEPLQGNCVLVKSEDHHQQQHQAHSQQHQLHLQSQHANGPEQPQHTAVKVLEITQLDSNQQRELQQAVKEIEHHQMQQMQHQQQSSSNGTQITQLHHQQVPTIQISREQLQPLFSGSTYSTVNATPQRQEDEYDAIGINVASKLRVMNPTQRIIAEKLISDVLFNGQLDNLTINSALTQ